MTPEELKEYLGIVVDLEKNIFMQERLIARWEKDIAGLGIAKEFQEPDCPQVKPLPDRQTVSEPNPRQPDPPAQPKMINWRRIIFWTICSAITVSYWAHISAGAMFLLWVGPIAGVIWGAVVVGIMGFCGAFSRYEEQKKKYEYQKAQYERARQAYPAMLEQHQQKRQQEWQKACEHVKQSNEDAMRDYQEKLDTYQSNVFKDQQRVRLENIKKEVLQAELSQLRELNAASRGVLKQAYGKNIIYPKYRNMVMICSLYEYVCAGRCSALEGYEGAYNLLELEIRMDKIVTQLDRVIQMLGTIQQNQYMVYSAIQDANRQSAKILEATYEMTNQLQSLHTSNQQMLGGIQAGIQMGIQAAEEQSVSMKQMEAKLSELQASSALTAYQAERAQKELHYMNQMDYLSGRNDDVFFNLPPV